MHCRRDAVDESPRVASAQASIQEAKRRVELEKQQRREIDIFFWSWGLHFPSRILERLRDAIPGCIEALRSLHVVVAVARFV